MELPKQLYLQTIEPRNVHIDGNSLEKSTGKQKPKFKIAGNRFNDEGVLFWVTTSNKDTYPKHKTTKIIYPDHYESCTYDALKNKDSYVCIDHVDYLLYDEIYKKYKDPENGFKKVGKITKAAFSNIANLRNKLRLSSQSDLKYMQSIVAATCEDEASSILEQLGL